MGTFIPAERSGRIIDLTIKSLRVMRPARRVSTLGGLRFLRATTEHRASVWYSRQGSENVSSSSMEVSSARS